MIVDFKDNSALDRYKLMSNFIIPRPIAWIVTKADVVNIAPFSYFAPISSDPPSLIVSIGHKRDRTPKDTLRNIREQKKCVVSIIEDDHLELLKLSSKELYRDVSEAEMFGIIKFDINLYLSSAELSLKSTIITLSFFAYI
jgi:flavin reductase (DIM6/NTAB) family NADH-FMN oxidoreductase RutF